MSGLRGTATLIVKLPSQDEAVRQRVALGYRSEYSFYTEVADSLTVPLPRWLLCEFDREGADLVLLMEDLAPAEQSFTGATMPKPDADFARGMGDLAVMAVETTVARLGERMSAEDRATLEACAAVIGRWLLTAPERFSLLHGDYRLDNLLSPGWTGRP